MSKIPPPVTADSSKSEMWGEIKALRAEVEQQQVEVNYARAQADKYSRRSGSLSYQLDIIKAVLACEAM